ncbi:hypothetical protein GCM10027440_41160 [Nocardiopsis coralliicola]
MHRAPHLHAARRLTGTAPHGRRAAPQAAAGAARPGAAPAQTGARPRLRTPPELGFHAEQRCADGARHNCAPSSLQPGNGLNPTRHQRPIAPSPSRFALFKLR